METTLGNQALRAEATEEGSLGSLPLVSVIIPVYNGGSFLDLCLKSVENQTYRNLEIVLIDDGSTDNSLDLIRRHARKDDRIRYLSFENHGQGYARNRALEIIQGEYVLFVDADDEIEPVTVEVAVNRALEDESDFVLFTYKYFRKPKQYIYKQVESFFGCRLLEGKDRFVLLDCKAYYSVTRLYRKKLLDDFSIRYSEGHLYEDNAVCLATVLGAKRVSIVHSPLYNIRISATSSTRSDLGSGRHAEDYLAAVDKCVSLLEGWNETGLEAARYYYARYAVRKFMEYYYRRVPKHLRGDFAARFVSQLKRLGDYPILRGNDKLLKLCRSSNVFEGERVTLFKMLVFYMKRIRPMKGKPKDALHAVRKKAKKLLTSPAGKKEQPQLEAVEDSEERIVLFMGFDFRYTGNSRYLFERFIGEYADQVTCRFATDDERVAAEYRLEPYSPEFASVLDRARVVVFESWIPGKIKKSKGSIWVQLWHGDPIKRMLFDSDEKEIFEKNPLSKTRHYADIRRWDFFVVESDFFAHIFQTAFLLERRKLILSCYPRVRYLLEEAGNESLHRELSEAYGLDASKKTVLYLPTWRDYNYGKDEADCDFRYRLDCDSLQTELGEGYEVIVKGHSYLGKTDDGAKSLPQDCETQELLLLADIVVTDYSSVVFDAAAIGKNILLFCNDFERFQASRGVYAHVWKHLEPFVCETESELAQGIRSYPSELAHRIEKLRRLSTSAYCSGNGIEKTILRFAQERRLPARSILVAGSVNELAFEIDVLRDLFDDCGANNGIVAYDATADEAGSIKSFAAEVGLVPCALRSEADLAELFDEFWIDRVVYASDIPEFVETCAREHCCDCFSLADCRGQDLLR